MAFYVTQCPVCESTFSATARMLESADGQVRCGACLALFDAIEHFINQQDASDNNTAGESVFLGNNPQDYFDPSMFLSRASLTEPDNHKKQDPKDDLIQANHEIGNLFNTLSFPAHNSTDSDIQESWEMPDDAMSFCEQSKRLEKDYQKNALLNNNANDQALGEIFDHREEQAIEQQSNSESGESHRESITKDLADTTPPPTVRAETLYASTTIDVFKSPQHLEINRRNQGDDPPPEEEAASAAVNDKPKERENIFHIRAPIVEIKLDVPQEKFESAVTTDDESNKFPTLANRPADAGNSKPIRKVANALDEPQPQDNIEKVDQSTEAIRARALENELEDEEALKITSEEHLRILELVVPSMELTERRDSYWFRRVTLTFISIFLGTVLFAQYLVHNTHIYGQQTEFRKFYIIVCDFLLCDLPEFSNIAAIRSDNLAVSSHLDAKNALAVNIVFRNTADFPQAFPILVLSFNTVNNDIIALREFAPTEYLNVGLRSMAMMPVMSPVQANLELVDPGPDAVNYTIAFRRP